MELKQNCKVKEYINSVCSHIKCREMHEEIKLELESHIEELAEEYIAADISENEAIGKAISRMGDSAVVGEQLNKIHKPRPEWSILILTLLFATSGLFAIYFIEVNGALYYSPSSMFTKSIVFTLLGLTVATGLYYIDYRKIQPFSKHIYLGTILILFLIVHTGRFVNGSVQYSFVQVCPIIFVIALAGILDGWNWNNIKMFCLGLGMLAIPVILMLAYPSLPAAVIYATVFIVLMITSGAKLKYVLPTAGSGLGIFYLSIISEPYRMQRLLGFINPSSDPLGSGYISIQLHNLLYSAGLFGQGFTFEPLMIHEVHTNFIFSYIVYTFGWLAGVVLIGLIAGYIIRLTSITRTVKDNYGKLLVTGFAVIFSIQFIWNILMTLGFAPIAGVSLPFISYGNTQFLINMIMVGLMFSIYRRKNARKLPVQAS